MKTVLPAGKVSRTFGLDGGLLVNFYDTFSGDINYGEPLYFRIGGLAVPFFIEHFERRGRNGALIRFSDMDNTERASELAGKEFFMENPLEMPCHAGSGTRPAGRIAENTAEQETDDVYETEGELFLEDMTGYAAVIKTPAARNGKRRKTAVRGRIAGFIESEYNPLFIIDIEGREVLVPAADEFITGIDTVKREAEFDLPEGLLELNP